MAFSDTRMDQLRHILTDAARAEILPRFRGLQASDVDTKTSAIDVVTAADIQAEIRITAALKAAFPDALVFGEEAWAKDKSVLNGLADAELAFIIDPVDGTLNFVKGLPLFGTILSITSKGETIGGLLYDPLNDSFLMASKGAGAFQVFGDGETRRVKTAAPTDLSAMSGALCLMFFPDPIKARVAANLTKIGPFHGLNCSVFDYWLVSTGSAHFTANFCGMYWDHLAGTLIHAEAGGYNAHFDGTPYNGRGEPANVLSAPDKESWELIKREFLGVE